MTVTAECPLLSLPLVERPDVLRRGDLVMLRLPSGAQEDMWTRAHEVLLAVTEKTGVEFLLLDADLEVVRPAAKDEPELPEMGQPEYRQVGK